MAATDLTAQVLRELLDYDPATGAFTWRPRPLSMFISQRLADSWNTQHAGKAAGGQYVGGYLGVTVFRRKHLAHRLAWLHATGGWPSAQIDHRDGCRNNNRLSNLRDVSPAENSQNLRKSKRRDGILPLGVRLQPGRASYEANIRTNGQRTFLGSFDTPEEAHAAYLSAKRSQHIACTI